MINKTFIHHVRIMNSKKIFFPTCRRKIVGTLCFENIQRQGFELILNFKKCNNTSLIWFWFSKKITFFLKTLSNSFRCSKTSRKTIVVSVNLDLCHLSLLETGSQTSKKGKNIWFVKLDYWMLQPSILLQVYGILYTVVNYFSLHN